MPTPQDHFTSSTKDTQHLLVWRGNVLSHSLAILTARQCMALLQAEFFTDCEIFLAYWPDTFLNTDCGSGCAGSDGRETSRCCQSSLLLDVHLSIIKYFKKNVEIDFSWQSDKSHLKCISGVGVNCRKKTREVKK